MSKIAFVRVTLDDDLPEDLRQAGIIRCGSVISEDEDGNEIEDHQDLIDNTEYRSPEELIKDVASRLDVDPSRVGIVD